MGVYKCPICNGTGLVNGNFYGIAMSWLDAMKLESHVSCKACYFDDQVMHYIIAFVTLLMF